MIDPVTAAGTRTDVISASAVERQNAVAEGDDFFSMMLSSLSEAKQSIQAAEATSLAGLKGEASTQEVVEATLAAQRSLAEVAAIRNKIVEAYLDVSRMQI